MTFDDVVTYRQTEPGPFDRWFRCNKGLEDTGNDLGGNTFAAVSYRDQDITDAICRCTDCNRASTLLTGIDGIVEQIKKHLLDLIGHRRN